MPLSAREQDQNGYLVVRGCPISSFGIFDYLAGQLDLPGDPNRVVRVFRPESTVNDQACIDSFKNVPLINDHEMLSGFIGDDSTTAPEDYGIDGVLTNNVSYIRPWMRGDIKVFTRGLQRDLASGKKDLSLGYTCDFDLQTGTFDGQPYEAVQTNMRGNHIALVDEGRIPGARVLDSKHGGRRFIFDHMDVRLVASAQGDTVMKLKGKAAKDDTVAELKSQLKALLPTFEQFLNEEAGEPEHQAAAPAAGAAEEQSVDPNAAPAAPPAPVATVPQEHDQGEVAAVPAAAAASAADPNAGGNAQLEAAVAQLEQLCAQLRAAMSGEGGEPTESPAEPGNGDEGAAVASTEDEGAAGGGEEMTEDNLEGLNAAVDEESESQAVGGLNANGQVKASPGPSAGEHSGGEDAAIRRFYADSAAKSKLYGRLSKVVGAFDGASMSSKQMAVYGAKKLKLNVAKGMEGIALDAYLTAIEAARRGANQQAVHATDSRAPTSTPEFDAYLEGSR